MSVYAAFIIGCSAGVICTIAGLALVTWIYNQNNNRRH